MKWRPQYKPIFIAACITFLFGPLLRAGYASSPFIDVWYGTHQVFGSIGVPQRWVNILGNVSDPDGVVSLTYSLNGAPAKPLSMGPDTRRLLSPGDFNVDLDYWTLPTGINQLVISARDALGDVANEVVTVEKITGRVWPLPYSIDWGTTGQIQDVAQIVDGLWSLQPEGIRPVILGYDRLVDIGDLSWSNYEVTVPVTIHGIDPNGYNPPSNHPAIGILLRWTGHFDWGYGQPFIGYYPMGAFGMYRYMTDSAGDRLWILGNEGVYIAEDLSGKKLSFGVRYIFKMRVETFPGQYHQYRLKVWKSSDPEPATWDLTTTQALTDPANGSLLLVAHHVDATFGNPSVFPIGYPQITALVPSFVIAGSPGFVLQVSGNNFVPGSPGSVVRWNDANRVTTFVSDTQLNASILSADLATPGTMPVTVFNPDGSLSNAMTFEVRTPQPAVIGLSPSWAISGDPSFTLTVDGSNFVSGAKVRWKGSDRATSFVSSTEVQAVIPAADIAAAGTASVTVYNPPPGGGTSNAISFDVFPVLVSLSLSPSSVVGGSSSTGTVTLSSPAPSGVPVVSLSSDNPSVATVPATVTVGSGNTSATFSVDTVAVSSSTAVGISALYGAATKSSPLTVNPSPVALVSLSLSPSSVVGGSGSTGTVTLSGAAPIGGAVVSLSSNNPSVATVPANVTVGSGNTSATFSVTTVAVSSSTAVDVSALYGGVTKSSNLIVETSSNTITLTGDSAGGGCSVISRETGSTPGGGFVVDLLLLVSPIILLRRRRAG